MYRAAVRRFVETEIAPRRHDLEHGDVPPYELLRGYYAQFGVGEAALQRFQRTLDVEDGRPIVDEPAPTAAEKLIPIIEMCRWCPGMVTAMGVSVGLTASAILRAGTRAQRERWVPDLLTLDKIGSWAITEPDSGSDAFGGMRSTARWDGDGFILNGQKTFITNGPHADTVVFICRLDDGRPVHERDVVTFVLDRGMDGLMQTPAMRKMGMHSSPTGELFVQDLRVGHDRLLAGGERRAPMSGRDGARATFVAERASVAAMALGIIERCLELSVAYAAERIQFGRRIGDFQLIQLKLAHMEVARQNVENLVFRYVETVDAGRRPTFAEASAMKLYAAQSAMQVALEAVQVFGGNGYMAENHVEQLCRDAKVLQIYSGTDEMMVRAIAKDLLRGQSQT